MQILMQAIVYDHVNVLDRAGPVEIIGQVMGRTPRAIVVREVSEVVADLRHAKRQTARGHEPAACDH